MMEKIRQLITEEKGQGMVEYGLILALIALVVVAALSPLGEQIKKLFNDIVSELGGTPAT